MDAAGLPGRRRRWRCGSGQTLRQAYESLGHTVSTIEPVPGLPDMVFAANGATVIDADRARRPVPLPERAAEAAGVPELVPVARLDAVHEAEHVNEGEGDILVAGDGTVLAGYGFRSDLAAAEELAAVFGRPVVSLRLVDPRFYHLDTALAVLDASTAMYYPAAFDDAGRAVLASLFPELIEAKDEDAEVLGLNAVSDGRHVVLAAAGDRAGAIADLARLRARPGGHVRAAQGRRRREVLHAGTEAAEMTDTYSDVHDPDRRPRSGRPGQPDRPVQRAQLPPAAGHRRRRRRASG